MQAGPVATPGRALFIVGLLASIPVQGQEQAGLVARINAFRAAPGTCDGRKAAPVAPLAPHAALSSVRVETGTFLEQALERAGYPVALAQAIFISGAPDSRAVMATIAPTYCKTLLSSEFSAVGAQRTGDNWLLVFARPAPPSPVFQLSNPGTVGRLILHAVNVARAAGRTCGEREFAAAPALAWNEQLGAAALAHSADMARQRYVSHQSKDGRTVGERAMQAGYRWRHVGENIAAGQESAEQTVAGWLSSPGHCANIMDPGFKDMGSAYSIDTARQVPRVYWTQVFGAPR